MPPSPIRAVTSYGPTRAPTVRATQTLEGIIRRNLGTQDSYDKRRISFLIPDDRVAASARLIATRLGRRETPKPNRLTCRKPCWSSRRGAETVTPKTLGYGIDFGCFPEHCRLWPAVLRPSATALIRAVPTAVRFPFHAALVRYSRQLNMVVSKSEKGVSVPPIDRLHCRRCSGVPLASELAGWLG